MRAGVATGPHFPAVVRQAREGMAFFRWADRELPKALRPPSIPSRVPRSRIAASAGPQSGSGRGLAAPVGSGRASTRLSPGFHPFRSFLRNIAVPSVLPVSVRQSGQQFRLGPGSRFLRPEAPVPLDGLRKVGSALALEPLPRASSSGRPHHFFRGFHSCEFQPCPSWCPWLPLPSVSGRPLPSTN
jgi:hypothetical protein